MSRYRPSMPPVAPYTGPLEPDEPEDPMPLKMRLATFLEAVKQYELPKDVSYFKPVKRGS